MELRGSVERTVVTRALKQHRWYPGYLVVKQQCMQTPMLRWREVTITLRLEWAEESESTCDTIMVSCYA